MKNQSLIEEKMKYEEEIFSKWSTVAEKKARRRKQKIQPRIIRKINAQESTTTKNKAPKTLP